MMVVELFFSWSFSPLSPPSSFFSLLPQVLLHFLSLPFFQPSLFPSLLLFFYFFPPSPYLLSWLPRWGIFGSERIHTFFSLQCLLTHWFPKRFCQFIPILCECLPSAMQVNAGCYQLKIPHSSINLHFPDHYPDWACFLLSVRSF